MKEENRPKFLEMLQILFIALRLCNVIDWSWVWVLGPLWMPIALKIIILALKAALKKQDKQRRTQNGEDA